MKANQYIVLLVLAIATAGCNLIDDDLSVCGADYLINYQMNLVTEVQTSIVLEAVNATTRRNLYLTISILSPGGTMMAASEIFPF